MISKNDQVVTAGYSLSKILKDAQHEALDLGLNSLADDLGSVDLSFNLHLTDIHKVLLRFDYLKQEKLKKGV